MLQLLDGGRGRCHAVDLLGDLLAGREEDRGVVCRLPRGGPACRRGRVEGGDEGPLCCPCVGVHRQPRHGVGARHARSRGDLELQGLGRDARCHEGRSADRAVARGDLHGRGARRVEVHVCGPRRRRRHCCPACRLMCWTCCTADACACCVPCGPEDGQADVALRDAAGDPLDHRDCPDRLVVACRGDRLQCLHHDVGG